VTAAPSNTTTWKSVVANGGIVALPAGTVDLDCNSQWVITKSTIVAGTGRDVTVIKDSCATGDSILVDVTNPADVQFHNVKIDSAAQVAIRLKGGVLGYSEVMRRRLTLEKVDVTGAANCIVTDGLNAFTMRDSTILHCKNDGAQISSFGVTLHDNWFGDNGRNGVTFLDSAVIDGDGQRMAGFCASCMGNEFWHNKAHGLVYDISAGIADARHVGDYVDSNGDIGAVISGVRDFSFTSGWVGSNKNGGMTVGPTQLGTVVTGTHFVTNFGINLTATKGSGPLRIQGNASSLQQNPCDASINGVCVSLND
jgi:hypothetical protein